MPFPFQQIGALQGTVPNQIPSFTPQNNEGLAVPWGQAMFNLPRFQMPGTTANFGGDLGSMGGLLPTASMRFSVSRQASSDPVQNIINDIANPLGGTSISLGGGTGGPSPLKQAMTGGSMQAAPSQAMGANIDPFSPRGIAEGNATNTAAQQGAYGWANPIPPYLKQQYASAPPPAPFGLRTRMLNGTNPALPVSPLAFF